MKKYSLKSFNCEYSGLYWSSGLAIKLSISPPPMSNKISLFMISIGEKKTFPIFQYQNQLKEYDLYKECQDLELVEKHLQYWWNFMCKKLYKKPPQKYKTTLFNFILASSVESQAMR